MFERSQNARANDGFPAAILLVVWSGQWWLMLLRFLLRRAALGGRCGASRGCAKITPFGNWVVVLRSTEGKES